MHKIAPVGFSRNSVWYSRNCSRECNAVWLIVCSASLGGFCYCCWQFVLGFSICCCCLVYHNSFSLPSLFKYVLYFVQVYHNRAKSINCTSVCILDQNRSKYTVPKLRTKNINKQQKLGRLG